jgi:hypothetical protein
VGANNPNVSFTQVSHLDLKQTHTPLHHQSKKDHQHEDQAEQAHEPFIINDINTVFNSGAYLDQREPA